jgi:hypothetical protein
MEQIMPKGIGYHESYRLESRARLSNKEQAGKGDAILRKAAGKGKGLKSEIKSPKKKKRTHLRSKRHSEIQKIIDKL